GRARRPDRGPPGTLRAAPGPPARARRGRRAAARARDARRRLRAALLPAALRAPGPADAPAPDRGRPAARAGTRRRAAGRARPDGTARVGPRARGRGTSRHVARDARAPPRDGSRPGRDRRGRARRRGSGVRAPRTCGALRLRERAADYAYVAARQVAGVLGARRPPSGPGGGAPVVLLPGVYETWRLLGPLATALARAGHPVHAVPGLGYNRRPVADAADRTAAFRDEADLQGVVLVAHGKGGLVGKRVMLSPAGSRVAGMVAVATPFRGSRYARYLLGRTLRAFSPRDAAL